MNTSEYCISVRAQICTFANCLWNTRTKYVGRFVCPQTRDQVNRTRFFAFRELKSMNHVWKQLYNSLWRCTYHKRCIVLMGWAVSCPVDSWPKHNTQTCCLRLPISLQTPCTRRIDDTISRKRHTAMVHRKQLRYHCNRIRRILWTAVSDTHL